MSSAETIRSFLAVDLPDAERQRAFAVSKRLRKAGVRVSWIPPERMHLTLRFLGEVTPDTISMITEQLENQYTAAEPFPLRLEGVGAFPHNRAPRIVWAGLAPLEGPLESVQAIAEAAAWHAGLPQENKRFRPHLTLGRVKDSKKAGALSPLIEEEQGFSGDEFTVSSVSLYASQLTSSGPIYNRLREFPFRWKS